MLYMLSEIDQPGKPSATGLTSVAFRDEGALVQHARRLREGREVELPHAPPAERLEPLRRLAEERLVSCARVGAAGQACCAMAS